ncbi:hypothetical protein [Nonomuraea rubra]|uniref:hypothetical protein n=1 Tax=Nonomuraea rubra TaxID=46180 RepID=UPI0033CA0D80
MERRLIEHLSRWLGSWPPAGASHIIGEPGRDRPARDGKIHPVLGVSSPKGGVLSVPPRTAEAVAAAYAMDTDSRFQAGVRAARLGWLDAG